jgi:hypothetical protein
MIFSIVRENVSYDIILALLVLLATERDFAHIQLVAFWDICIDPLRLTVST